ncbi:hypothetical protein C4573_00115 [Candidatus Woesearchaeota archaeon]|nr:MAG: hypothetical protein C4573_00115 [Candidatus Woesearchaeota archaeon]
MNEENNEKISLEASVEEEHRHYKKKPENFKEIALSYSFLLIVIAFLVFSVRLKELGSSLLARTNIVGHAASGNVLQNSFPLALLVVLGLLIIGILYLRRQFRK